MSLVLSTFFSLTFQVLNVVSQNGNANGSAKDENCGINDFKTIITEKKNIYVDKTLFIKEVLSQPDDVILITRPPRFGKTLTLSTLDYFLSDRHKDSAQLFSGLDIMRRESDFEQVRNTHMNKYSVIYLDLSNVRGSTYNESYSALQKTISEVFAKHKYLVESRKLLAGVFESILHMKADEKRTADSINWLCRWISTYHNGAKRCFVLIDGYDIPIHIGFIKDHYKETERFMTSFLMRTLRKNTNLQKAIITGVIPVADRIFPIALVARSIFAATFSQALGFTERDIRTLVERNSIGTEVQRKLERVDAMFNGYNFRGSTMFNPSAVTQYLFRGKVGGSLDTNSRNYLRDMLMGYGLYPVLTIQQLLAQEQIATVEVSDSIDFTDEKNREQKYWAYMLHAGYLTVSSISASGFGRSDVVLRIPNQEIHAEIGRTLEVQSRMFNVKIPSYKDLTENLALGNFALAQGAIENYLKNAGEFIKMEEDSIEKYVTQMLRGVELRYSTKMEVKQEAVVSGNYYYHDVHIKVEPRNKAGVTIRVFIRFSSMFKVLWNKLKRMLCPVASKLDKDRTEIVILYTEGIVSTCLRQSSR